ncbi:MAG: XRE family transcriptional regulator [Candidatus Omnitrophica bacterium]|nr:XRE family transcriptional regulator [Candidatus Omnitrophota bacterium]
MNKEKAHRGSDNIFVDIGVAHPERVMARAQIMSRVAEIIKNRGLTQKAASELLDIPQPKVSCLMNGKLSMFSLDHLFELLNRVMPLTTTSSIRWARNPVALFIKGITLLLNSLDRDVEIIIKPKTKQEKFATTHVILSTSF